MPESSALVDRENEGDGFDHYAVPAYLCGVIAAAQTDPLRPSAVAPCCPAWGGGRCWKTTCHSPAPVSSYTAVCLTLVKASVRQLEAILSCSPALPNQGSSFTTGVSGRNAYNLRVAPKEKQGGGGLLAPLLSPASFPFRRSGPNQPSLEVDPPPLSQAISCLRCLPLSILQAALKR